VSTRRARDSQDRLPRRREGRLPRIMELMARIAVITSVHRPFDQRIFYKECRSLARAGHQVTLIAPADFEDQEREGVQVLGIPQPRSRWGRPTTWLRLVTRVLRQKPDLVHFHDPELLLIVPILRLTLGRRLRIVYDVHEYFVDSIAHKVWIPPRLRPAAAWLASSLERMLGRSVDGLVFVVEEQAPLYARWRATQVVVHNYPQQAAFADPAPVADLAPDRFRLIYVGSLFARRGIMTMLEALAQVVPQAPETLLILGGAYESDAFQAQVEAFIEQHGLGANVTALGWVDYDRLKDYLVSADVAWLPGLRVKQYQRRGISTKLLECMLMGLPIVSSDHPHRRLFIDEARCGFSVTADDPAAHAGAILALYRNPDRRRAMGARGRQLVLERYTWETEEPILLAFYGQLLSEGDE
jgi:glycosyltransferase involved in cell wall biosynthesis